MTCSRCRKRYSARAERCPHCGDTGSGAVSGLFQTSTVLISMGRTDVVYRSVEDVPGPLRNKLLKSTNGSNSATILIADRRGRREIARAMRTMPGPMQRRLMHAVLGAQTAAGAFHVSPARKAAIGGFLLLVIVVLIWFLFAWR